MEPTAVSARPAKPKATEADLDQDQGKVQEGKGKLGTRENPEVYENVPGNVIPSSPTRSTTRHRGHKFLAATPEDHSALPAQAGRLRQRQPGVR